MNEWKLIHIAYTETDRQTDRNIQTKYVSKTKFSDRNVDDVTGSENKLLYLTEQT